MWWIKWVNGVKCLGEFDQFLSVVKEIKFSVFIQILLFSYLNMMSITSLKTLMF